MEGVFKRFKLKVGESKTIGSATISAYEFSNKKDPFYNLRAVRDSGGMLYMADGKYIRLLINSQLFMSDTRMEINSNREFINNAKGRVFIAGLGIGLIIHNLKDKVKKGIVSEIVIMDNNQDVIDLVSPYYKDFPIKYICDDVINYKPSKDEKYDTIYFDIWEDIDEDNLTEIAALHNLWKNRKNKGGWMNSWMVKFLRQKRASYSNY